jgi:hypothetical protein
VNRPPGDSIEKDGQILSASRALRKSSDAVPQPVPLSIRVEDVDEAVLREIRIESEPQQSSFAFVSHRNLRPWLRLHRPIADHANASGPLRQEDTPIGGEIQSPRDLQALGDNLNPHVFG